MIAVMDVGSNSVRMMLAEQEAGDFRTVDRDICTTRLIAGMRDGVLAPEACARTLDAMRRFAQRARAAGCQRVFAFGTSALPSVTSAWARGSRKELRSRMETVVRVTSLFCFPAGIGMAALAQPIARLFYGEGQSTPIVARSLALLGIASLASSLCGPFSSMLQAVGKAGWNVRLLVAAMALKLAANWFLCAIPEMNIQGAALGTLASYLFLAAAQLGYLRRATGVRLSWLGSFLRPLACALLCGMGARLAYGALGPLLPSGRWGDGAALLAAVAFGAGLYLAALLLLRGIRKSDLQSLPKGQKIAKTLEKQGWI